jgi:hypothetical protein
MNIGDIVKHHDADAPKSLPAYRSLRGRIITVSEDGRWVRVHWNVDRDSEPFFRSIATLRIANDGEATCY